MVLASCASYTGIRGNGKTVMATNFVETWQTCAFQEPAYSKSEKYSAILSVLLEDET